MPAGPARHATEVGETALAQPEQGARSHARVVIIDAARALTEGTGPNQLE